MSLPLPSATAGGDARTSAHGSPRVSPRTDPLSRLGPIQVYSHFTEKSGGGTKIHLVNGVFQSRDQQASVFTQLLELERSGVRRFDYSMRLHCVEFYFADKRKSDQFVERVNTIAATLQPHPPAAEEILIARDSLTPRPSPTHPFTRWGCELTQKLTVDVDSEGRTTFRVDVVFENAERQLVVRKDLNALIDAGVQKFDYSLADTAVSFTFHSEEEALNFMRAIEPPKVQDTFSLQPRDDSKAE